MNGRGNGDAAGRMGGASVARSARVGDRDALLPAPDANGSAGRAGDGWTAASDRGESPASVPARAGATGGGLAAEFPAAEFPAAELVDADFLETEFLEAMQDVAPLAQERVAPAISREVTEAQRARRQAAEHDSRIDDPNYLHFRGLRPVAPEELIEYYKEGVQHGVRKKLRRGDYPIQDALDLHRRTVLEARHELFWFLRRALERELRLVLVSHGKGLQSETPGRLKSHVAHWLRQVPEVVAYSSAQRPHGGTGAVYVLLRKGELERIENRERHGHKGRLDHTR